MKEQQPLGLPHPLIHTFAPLTVQDCRAILCRTVYFSEFIKHLDLREHEITPAGLAGIRAAINLVNSTNRHVSASLAKLNVPRPPHPLVHKTGPLTLADCKLILHRSTKFMKMLTYFDPSGKAFNVAAQWGYHTSMTMLVDTARSLHDAVSELEAAENAENAKEKQCPITFANCTGGTHEQGR